jgi:hypothetical protein
LFEEPLKLCAHYYQGHFAKIWEMAVLLIFLPQFLSILSNLALAKIGPILAIFGIGLTRPDQTRLGVDFGNAHDQRPNFDDAPISHDAKKWCAAAAPCLPR